MPLELRRLLPGELLGSAASLAAFRRFIPIFLLV